MILLDLFFVFFEVGAVSFGGGYGMISVIRDAVIGRGWLSATDFMSFIAVSESTPGPLAVNMATFIGSERGGLPGAIAATVGVVLPAFLIILFISAVMKNMMKHESVRAVLSGIRPCVTALILTTGILMLLSTVFGFGSIYDISAIDIRAAIIFIILAATALISGKVFKKRVSPILLIIFSAALGIVFYM